MDFCGSHSGATIVVERCCNAHEAIRENFERVVIYPQAPYTPVEVEIYGGIAALLRMSDRAAADPLESRCVLVAGIGFGPVKFAQPDA